MYHIVGVTPEAESVEMAFGPNEPVETFTYGKAERRQVYDRLNANAQRSERGLRDARMPARGARAAAGSGARCSTARRSAPTARCGSSRRARSRARRTTSGIHRRRSATPAASLLTDTCSAFAQALPPGTKVAALDSAKQAHYLPAILGVQAWFGSTTRLHQRGGDRPLERGAAMTVSDDDRAARAQGRAAGAPKARRSSRAQTIPGWGGVNPVQGVITETQHELRGAELQGQGAGVRGAKGSSGWSAMYHTARLAGTAPKALIFNEMTTKVALGAVVMRVPSITDLDRDPLDVIETGDWVMVDADRGIVEIVKKTQRSTGGSSDPPGGRSMNRLVALGVGVACCRGGWRPRCPRRQEARARPQVRDAATRAVAAIQKAQAPWYTTNKQVCASCHHQYQPALAFRVARDHGVPLDEAIASADAIKAFTFADIDRAIQYTYVIEPAMDDAYRMVAANAAGVKPNLGAAVYARLLISRQNRDGDWDGFHQRPPSSYSRVTMAALGLRAVQVYHHASQKAQADAAVARARTFLEARTPRDTEERSYQLLGLRWAGADRATLQKLARDAQGHAASPMADGARCRAARATCTRPAQALVALHDGGGVGDHRSVVAARHRVSAEDAGGRWHVARRRRGCIRRRRSARRTSTPAIRTATISSSRCRARAGR